MQTCREHLSWEFGLTGISVVFREGRGEGCQRDLFGEDAKLKLEDYSGVKYTMDPGDDPDVRGIFLNYVKRFLGNRVHTQREFVSLSCPHGHVSSTSCQSSSQNLPLNLSLPILPPSTVTYTHLDSSFSPSPHLQNAISDLTELNLSEWPLGH